MYNKKFNVDVEIQLFTIGDKVKNIKNPMDLKVYEIVDVEYDTDILELLEKEIEYNDIVSDKFIDIATKKYNVQVKYKIPGDPFFTYDINHANGYELISDESLNINTNTISKLETKFNYWKRNNII